jgi:hypothetical protein
MEYTMETLAPDALFESPSEGMINTATGDVEFENAEGACFNRTYPLSALGKTEDDLLKPLFPIFNGK